MVTEVIALLKIGLGLWADKNKTKYIDRLNELELEHYEEMSIPYEDRDNAKLDLIEFKLRQLSRDFATAVATAKV